MMGPTATLVPSRSRSTNPSGVMVALWPCRSLAV